MSTDACATDSSVMSESSLYRFCSLSRTLSTRCRNAVSNPNKAVVTIDSATAEVILWHGHVTFICCASCVKLCSVYVVIDSCDMTYMELSWHCASRLHHSLHPIMQWFESVFLSCEMTVSAGKSCDVTLLSHSELHTSWHVLSAFKQRCVPRFHFPSNRHHWSNGDCLEGKREDYQVCSVQYCVQHLCTVQCAHMKRSNSCLNWLDLAFWFTAKWPLFS